MNSSTAAGMPTDISRCMFSSVTPVSRCVDIDDQGQSLFVSVH